MRIRWLIVLLMLGGWGLPAGAAETADAAGAAEASDEVDPASRWHFTAGALLRSYSHGHDALQHRADYELDGADAWEDGSTDGDGFGLRLTAAKGAESATLHVISSSYGYDLLRGPGWHAIDTDRLDIDVWWARTLGGLEEGSDKLWGWRLGARYLAMDKSVRIVEPGVDRSFDGDQTWRLLQAGYFGVWRPFGWHLNVHGALHAMLGETSGTARSGNDERWNDGRIRETYADESSLSYGAKAAVGVSVDVLQFLSIGVDYQREWLYSFEATDSGTVVFPDNDDALFIENTHAVTAHIDVQF